jgi:hypothetical protein
MRNYKRISAKSEKRSVTRIIGKNAFCFILTVLVTIFYPNSGRSTEQNLISLDVQNGTLGKTLKMVSEMSGYTIELQQVWHEVPVTVRLVNLPLEQAIVKILDNRINYAITWNHRINNIAIFGSPLSQERGQVGKEGNRSINERKAISGQGIRFEQASRTTDY